jgi:hypothetical protein
MKTEAEMFFTVLGMARGSRRHVGKQLGPVAQAVHGE